MGKVSTGRRRYPGVSRSPKSGTGVQRYAGVSRSSGSSGYGGYSGSAPSSIPTSTTSGPTPLSTASIAPTAPRPRTRRNRKAPRPNVEGAQSTSEFNLDLTKRGARQVADVLADPIGTATKALLGGGKAKGFSVPNAVPASQNTQRPRGSSARVTGSGERSRAPRQKGPTLFERLDRGFKPGETISPRQTALLAEAFGLPGITYSKAIVPGESGYQPGIRNPDDNTPSLFQITPSVQSAETQAKFNRIASKHKGGYSNPIAAAKMAAFLAGDSADEGVSNYVAFNPSAPQGHLPGGRRRAREILGGRSKGGGGFGGAPNAKGLSVNELFYDPGISLADGQETGAIGGHSDHVHFGSESPRDILRVGRMAKRLGLRVAENPAFETVDPVHTEGSMHYSEQQIPRKLRQSKLYQRSGASGTTIGNALDISGDPAAMAKLDRRIANRSGAIVSGSGSYAAPGGGGVGAVGSTGGTASSPSQRDQQTLRSVLGGPGTASRNPLAATAPKPTSVGKRRRRGEEDEGDPELNAIIDQRFRPQRALG